MAVVVGTAGGSGSGKTTLVEAILRGMVGESVVRLEQDSYYRDRSDLTTEERERINYDHPDSLGNTLRVDGILVLENPALRGMMDPKLFVDTDLDVRFIRRLRRDLQERERTLESGVEQYLSTARPTHQQFVEPSRCYADVIIPEGGLNGVATNMVIARLGALLSPPFLVPKSSPPVE